MKNPLLDIEFLKKLYKQNKKELYAKIVALNVYEEPIEEITGKITGGSINVDGNSAVRRTCSISLLAYDIKLTDYYWGVKTKFNLSIGLKNDINKNYPDIIWFPQGIFIITSFNSSQSINAFNISLNGQDKMCLLNGDVSGNIHANSTRFDIIEEYDKNGDRTEIKLPIKNIIKEMVHGHAGEALYNIIINDLDDYGLELLEYRGSDYLYIIFKGITDEVENITLEDPSNEMFQDEDYRVLTTQNGLFNNTKLGSLLPNGNTVARIAYGEAAGYRLTDLIYPGELIANVGETVTSVLDKIKTMLGDYEYFYDIDGRFIFQKKKTYLNTSWNNLRTGSDGIIYADAAAYQSPIVWNFEGNDQLTTISNNPVLNNLKNDFSIWGVRKAISGAEIPIHLRYAVDKKPEKYTTIADITKIDENGASVVIRPAGITYIASDKYEPLNPSNVIKCDFREIIYQMALDYRKAGHNDSFISDLIRLNPETCSRGRTGYEQYYIDMEGFWRQIYNPESDRDFDSYPVEENGWHINTRNNPSVLNFWIDFLDSQGDIAKFSIPAIGDRAKVINDNSIKSIYFKDTPLIIYYDEGEDRYKKPGYSYAQLTSIEDLFSISAQGKTAKDELDSLLYSCTYCSETISLSSVPIYSLQVNTHISVKDDENIGVNGEYVVSRITIPLNYNGMMSISATKVPDRII